MVLFIKVESSKNRKKEKEVNKEVNDLEEIEEPDNFFISSNYEGFIIDSKEDAEKLLKDLENSKYNEKLAHFYLNFKRDEIKDFTKG